MHPADVAPFVAAAVDELRERVATLPGLGVHDVKLREHTTLYVHFETRTSEAAAQVLPFGLAPVAGAVAVTGGMAVPIIGTSRTERFILKLDCTDWDSQPPTIELCDADGNPLAPDRWPHDKTNQGIVQGHPDYGDRKFFCREGTREFHTHPQHEDQPWDRCREGLTLHGIVISLLYDLTHRWTFR
jgi:hypothetical protein